MPSAVPGLLAEGLLAVTRTYVSKLCSIRRLEGIEKKVPSAVPGLLAEGLLFRMLGE